MWTYPVVLHKDKGSDFGVIVPDLPGCFSAGRTVDEALAMARQAIELHVEGLIEDGEPIPEPGNIEQHRRNGDYAGGTWAVVSIEPDKLRFKAKRLSITMPERMVESVDRYAKEHGLTRSGLLARAAARYIGRGDDAAMRHKGPGKPRKLRTKAKQQAWPSNGKGR
ncbi:MAG: type II toxin-antitoxin system HicB family antitoxin [Phycisphaeraceae bacterium]